MGLASDLKAAVAAVNETDKKLARLVGQRGDEEGCRQARLTAEGLATSLPAQSSRNVLFELAETAALLGHQEAAQDYLDRLRVRGSWRDGILAQVAMGLVCSGRLAEGLPIGGF